MFLRLRFLLLGMLARLLLIDKYILKYYARSLTSYRSYETMSKDRSYTLGRLHTLRLFLDLFGFSKQVTAIGDKMITLRKVD